MRRVTLALVLLAAALALPVGVLVARALESAALESSLRHRAVAERTFDEMERALSDFLAGEEARPFQDYLDGARTPVEPFVVAHFEIEPDGRLRVPRRAGADGSALERDLRSAWELAQRAARTELASGLEGATAIPEVLFALEPKKREPAAGKDEGQAVAVASRDAAEDSPYDLLRRLNRAPDERRASRRQKVTVESVPDYRARKGGSSSLGSISALADAATASADAEAEVELPPEAFERDEDEAGAGQLPESRAAFARRRAPATPAPERAGRAVAKADAPRPAAAPLPLAQEEAAPEPTARPYRTPTRAVRVALDPMVGRPAGDGRLLLYRTVLVGEQGYRQGLLLDWRRLGDWLDERVLAATGLGQTARARFVATSEPPAAAGERRYGHRFAEPFDAFGVELELAPLATGSGTGTIYALTGLLLLVGAAGLLAVHRMVAVVVGFAERRSNFAASVSHELKTPLTSIRMYAEMLRDGLVGSDEKRSEYYRTITDESERLSRLIDNVLAFSRLERGERDLRVAEGELAPVVEEAIARLAPHAERQGFALALEIEPGLPRLRFDADALTQIVFNLVDNALKYASGGTRREVQVRCARHPEGGVRLSVRDFGPGVPAALRERIFEPFYRSEDELTRTTKGTGIGLALVKQLADAMGGALDTREPEGGGFEIGLHLPAA